MCGIAGILYKNAKHNFAAGRALIEMLDGCQHRGPDSTGFALYSDPQPGELRLAFLCWGRRRGHGRGPHQGGTCQTQCQSNQ